MPIDLHSVSAPLQNPASRLHAKWLGIGWQSGQYPSQQNQPTASSPRQLNQATFMTLDAAIN